MRRICVGIAVLAALAAGIMTLQTIGDRKPGSVSIQEKELPSASARLQHVIVRTSKVPEKQDAARIAELGGTMGRTFEYLPGYSAAIPESAIAVLTADANVLGVSLDSALESYATSTPVKDARVSSGANTAHERYYAKGNGIGVAVIDSGIDRVSDVSNDRVLYSVDYTTGASVAPEDDETNGDYRRLRNDPLGHGTHVAGIIAGNGEDSNGAYRGVAPSAHLINLRVLDAQGWGRTENVIAAIEWVLKNRNKRTASGRNLNIRVINLSLGYRPTKDAASDPVAAMARIAVQQGIVVVAAAGNYGQAPDGSTVYGSISSPGIEPSVITVGAMTTWGTDSRADDVVATYSSRGPAMGGIMKPDITAPGTMIASLNTNDRRGSTLVQLYPWLVLDNNNYIKLSGTSMATPVVSGAVAAILAKNPELTPNAVKAILMFTAEKRGGNPLDIGAGYINFPGAVNLAMNIKADAASSSYWLLNNGAGLTYTDVIAGHPAVWGQTIVWEGMTSGANLLAFNQPAFAQTIVWESMNTVWVAPVTKTPVPTLVSNISGQTIVWEALQTLKTSWKGQTIVWEGLTIVWEALDTQTMASFGKPY